MSASVSGNARQRGFTLVELMIVVSILAIVASIGVPNYFAAVRTARIGKARHELRTISAAVDAYCARIGALPLTLRQVGFGGKRDPWGVPYCYLNYGAGTGDGLDWAVEQGLVDPSAFSGITAVAAGGDGGDGLPPPQQQQQAQQPTADQLAAEQLKQKLTYEQKEDLKAQIEAEGDFELFLGVQVETTKRRDRYMFPLNTDYDLFSLGPDSRTATSLGEKVGLDDVIRANNGGYFGTAGDY